MAGIYIFTYNFLYCCCHIYIYILSSLVVQLHFMDDGYTHVQLHLTTTFLCLRILKCSPLQSTLRTTLERSLPRLLCRRSSTKKASFIVQVHHHDEVPGIYVHSICPIASCCCAQFVNCVWSWEIQLEL